MDPSQVTCATLQSIILILRPPLSPPGIITGLNLFGALSVSGTANTHLVR
jgi:hypothetical protein